jgi:hypothetical protein
VAGLFIKLMEADLFAFRRSREKGYGAGNKGQLQVSLPIRTRRHDELQYSKNFTLLQIWGPTVLGKAELPLCSCKF